MLNALILASSHQDRLALWQQGLVDYVITPLTIDNLISLRDDVIRIEPGALLLDFDLLGEYGMRDILSLRGLCAETKVIILSGDISEDLEWELLKAGIQGCCRKDIKPEFLKQVVGAVLQGELWVRRTLTCRLIDELGKTTSKNKAYRATLGLLNKLTQREYDIAVRVGNGENNKQIAQACDITERTVKAHLTEIFSKLGVADRLNLALAISSDNRNALENLDSTLKGEVDQLGQLSGTRDIGGN